MGMRLEGLFGVPRAERATSRGRPRAATLYSALRGARAERRPTACNAGNNVLDPTGRRTMLAAFERRSLLYIIYAIYKSDY